MDILKVSSKSNPNMVAGALTGMIKEEKNFAMQAVGAGAINQAVKAVAIAKSFVNEEDKEIYCTPEFITLEINGEEKTGIKFYIGLK